MSNVVDDVMFEAEKGTLRDPRTGLITAVEGRDGVYNSIAGRSQYEYRDSCLLALSMELHEILFGILIGQYKAEIPEDIEDLITSLQTIKSRLSALMDEHKNFERELVKPIAELRAKVTSYIIYSKQWRSLGNVTS